MAEPIHERRREVEVGGGAVLIVLLLIGGAFGIVVYHLDQQHRERMMRAGFCETFLENAKGTVMGWRPCSQLIPTTAPRPY